MIGILKGAMKRSYTMKRRQRSEEEAKTMNGWSKKGQILKGVYTSKAWPRE